MGHAIDFGKGHNAQLFGSNGIGFLTRHQLCLIENEIANSILTPRADSKPRTHDSDPFKTSHPPTSTTALISVTATNLPSTLFPLSRDDN